MLTLVDTPGHPNFSDELAAGMRVSDGVLLVVDAVEGAMMVTEMAVAQAASEGLPVVLVLSKVRLPLPPSLPLPPPAARRAAPRRAARPPLTHSPRHSGW